MNATAVELVEAFLPVVVTFAALGFLLSVVGRGGR